LVPVTDKTSNSTVTPIAHDRRVQPLGADAVAVTAMIPKPSTSSVQLGNINASVNVNPPAKFRRVSVPSTVSHSAAVRYGIPIPGSSPGLVSGLGTGTSTQIGSNSTNPTARGNGHVSGTHKLFQLPRNISCNSYSSSNSVSSSSTSSSHINYRYLKPILKSTCDTPHHMNQGQQINQNSNYKSSTYKSQS
jgi:hypothetical protein